MIIRAYLSGIVPPLCITREVSCHCSGSGYDIGSFAASYVRDLFGNGDVFADGLDQQYYFVATPAKQAGASAVNEVQIAVDPFVGGWDVYCLRASGSDDKGVKIPRLLARLRSEFELTQLTEEVIVASCCPPQQSEISDCERTFDDCTTMTATEHSPGTIFLAREGDDPDSASSRASSISRTSFISPPAYDSQAFGHACRETETDSDAYGKAHSLVGFPAPTKSPLPLVPKAAPQQDLTRRDPVAAQPPPTPSHLAITIRPHQKLVGGTPQQDGVGTPTKHTGQQKISGIPSRLDLYGVHTPTATHLLDVSRTGSPAGHLPLRLEASAGAKQESDGSQENVAPGSDVGESPGDRGTSDVEDVDASGKVNEESESSKLNRSEQASKPPSSLLCRSHSSSDRARMTNGHSLPDVNTTKAGMVPGVESKIPQERSAHSSSSCTENNVVSNFVPMQPKQVKSNTVVHENSDHSSTSDDHQEEKGVPHIELNLVKAEAVQEGRGSGGVGEREEVVMEGDNKLTLPQPLLRVQRQDRLRSKREHSTEAKPMVPQAELDRELRMMHALEHACNGRDGPCHLGNEEHLNLCGGLYDAVLVADMEVQMAAYNRGAPLSETVRALIVRHCNTPCRDATCKVPHQAAGCRPAWQNPTPTPSPLPSTSTTTTTSCHSSSPSRPSQRHSAAVPSLPPSPHMKGMTAGVSFDVYPAFLSKSDEFPTQPQQQHPSPPRTSSPPHTPSPSHTPSPLPAVPVAVHTASDSPRHHPTHIPPCPSHHQSFPNENAMLVPTTCGPSAPKFLSTLFQGTFTRNVYEGGPYRVGCWTPPRATATLAEVTEEQCSQPRQARPQLTPSPPGSPQQHRIWQSKSPGEFPPAANLSPNMVIFSRVECVTEGTPLPLHHLDKSPQLGKGGNGTIVKYPLLYNDYAVKSTGYRTTELNEWHMFDHPNVVKLLMVINAPPTHTPRCHQLMDLMDGSLSTVIRRVCHTGLCRMYSHVSQQEWKRVLMPNASHIMRGSVMGLAYLHESKCIQHIDLKGSNILIKKLCSCPNIFWCQCPLQAKCLVQLADFDSAKKFKPRVLSTYHGWEPYVRMSPEECSKVMGTPGYRAPEQFMKLAPVVSPDHLLFEVSLEGPWTDIWSLGHICLNIFLGPNSAEDKHKAWTMHCRPYIQEFSRTNTQPELTHAILRSRELAMCQPRAVIDSASNFAVACIEPDFRRRPTAKGLLGYDLLSWH